MLGLFSWELIFGEAFYWNEFCVSKWVGVTIKTATTNSPWAYIREGLSFGRICASDLGAYLREGLFLGGLLTEFYSIYSIPHLVEHTTVFLLKVKTFRHVVT